MRRVVLALALVSMSASPALAGVEDPLELLGPGVAKSLAEQLANLHAEDIDVVVTNHAPAGAAVEAAQVLAQRKRGAESGVVLVAADEGTAGVALGASYTDRGVTPETTAKLVKTHVEPAFKAGQPTDGLVELVREIKLARTLGRPKGYVPPPPPPRTPWELLVAGGLAIAGGSAWALAARVRRRKRLALEERVRGERGRLAKLREDLRVLGERADAAGPGPAAQALAAGVRHEVATLDAEQAELRQTLRGLAERLDAGKATEVATGLAGLEPRLARLHIGVSLLVAAGRPLASEGAAIAEALRLAEARLAVSADPGVVRALAEARAALEAGAPIEALEALAHAHALAAPADPDEAWLSLASPPSAAPAHAADMATRWEQLRRELAADPARGGREALRGRLDELAKMMMASRPDLARIQVLLEATERLERSRREMGRGAPVEVP